jgi:cellulose synthase/poly-beta-1,6-N-acetylglucosamine synthase-like glycosyltransferase
VSAPERTPGTVTVILTVLNDRRVERTLHSLLEQRRRPDRILVDDGSGPDGIVRPIVERWRARDPRVEWLDAPGTISESRNRALQVVSTEFVAFIDADEIARPEWLGELLGPFDDPRIGFTGGPTPALPSTCHGAGVRYYDGYLRRFYDVTARAHPTSLPMGNSAWRTSVFDQLGLLDATLYPYASSEDQEMAVRASRAGWKGRYVPGAIVDHDFSELTSGSLLRKQSRYATGGYLVWRRHASTYEATGGRLAPYVLLPALAVLGAIFLAFPQLYWPAVGLLATGSGGLAVLALGLSVQGLRWERTYPGMRFRAFEMLRRWATLFGAFRGLIHYGWTGRREVGSASTEPPRSGKP